MGALWIRGGRTLFEIHLGSNFG